MMSSRGLSINFSSMVAHYKVKYSKFITLYNCVPALSAWMMGDKGV